MTDIVAPPRVWVRIKDGQLGEAYNGCMGWVWFYGELESWMKPYTRGDPILFVDDLKDPDSPRLNEFEDLGEL